MGPESTRAALLTSAYVKKNGKKGEVPKGTEVIAVPEGMVVITCGKTEQYCPGVAQDQLDRTYFYLFKYDPQNKEKPVPEMSGDDLKRKGTRQDIDSQTNQPVVLMQFTNGGAKKFQDVTRTLVERGRILANRNGWTGAANDQANQQFAIVLDREMKSAPSVDFDENPSGIPGTNGAQITGVSIGEAKDLALVLRSGTLPFKLVTIEQTNISATLGKDSLQQAKKAAIGGLIAVAIFLLIFYRFLGLVAVIGLGIYAAFLYAAVLHLPRHAHPAGLCRPDPHDRSRGRRERGRLRTNQRRGPRGQIRAGRDLHRIREGVPHDHRRERRDGDHGARPVPGRDRGRQGLRPDAPDRYRDLAGHGGCGDARHARAARRLPLVRQPALHGRSRVSRARSWLQIDFMGKRRLWFAISGVVVLVALVSLGVRGLNLGIDFKGGTQVTFDTPQRRPSTTCETTRSGSTPRSARPSSRGEEPQSGGKYKSFQIRTKSLDPARGGQLRSGLESQLQATHYGSKNVSESFGRQIARSAIIAIIFSLFLIVLYLAIRFDMKYALPVIAALIHDIVITVGVYSLTGREVSTATVAAVLTVLGYSIYDTIIIFDRIRENVPLMRRASFATITNISLWETIRRSLATTFITLLPVASLVRLRRGDAQGLRLRAVDRHHLGCVLVDLHRGAAADDPQGARARVRTEDRPGRSDH